MDELEISGKRFISTRRAAKEYKYHSDYIGQLIRGNKVVGQKVGRAWYAEADSLAKYFETGASTVAGGVVEGVTKEITSEASIPEPKSEPTVPVEPEITPEPVENPFVSHVVGRTFLRENFPDSDIKIESTTRDSIHIPIRRADTVPVRKTSGLTYITDESPSLPSLKKYSKLPTQESEKISYVTTHPQYAEVQIRGSSGVLVPAISIAIIGAFAFIAVAASSIMVSSNILIEAGKAASAWYSLK